MIYRLFYLFTGPRAVPHACPLSVPAQHCAGQILPIHHYLMGFPQRRHPKNTIATQNVVEYYIKLGGILRTPPIFGVRDSKIH
jgi:hypothetical protein